MIKMHKIALTEFTLDLHRLLFNLNSESALTLQTLLRLPDLRSMEVRDYYNV
jgi:hypothetical protein